MGLRGSLSLSKSENYVYISAIDSAIDILRWSLNYHPLSTEDPYSIEGSRDVRGSSNFYDYICRLDQNGIKIHLKLTFTFCLTIKGVLGILPDYMLITSSLSSHPSVTRSSAIEYTQ